MKLRVARALVLALSLGVGCAVCDAQKPVPAAPAPDGPNAPVEFKDISTARKKADEVLNRREFRHVEQSSFMDRMMAKFWSLLDRLLSRAAQAIPYSPWYATALATGVLVLVAAGLLLWVWRVSKQQRLAIASAHGSAIEVWQKESDNWAERARTEAERGDWREAVHCLYWSAIVMLEGQKLWRQNRARTPREYLVLLPAGSVKQQALGGLTRVFERIWYGLRPAAESDYRQASAMLEQLRAR